MISQNVKKGVIAKLQETYGPSMYTHQNVMLSSTHTHSYVHCPEWYPDSSVCELSGPGGYHEYLLYGITAYGYIHDSAELMIVGIYESIVRAHESQAPGHIYSAVGKLLDANINRSPSAYLANPSSEREFYAEDGDTDKKMTLLKLVDSSSGLERGLINWFSVHCTSMNNSNRLVSGDNKGYASYLMETHMNQDRLGAGKSLPYYPYLSDEYKTLTASGKSFIAAFSQSNEVPMR